MNNSSFYSESELMTIGFKSFGCRVKISRKASIYNPANITIGNNVRIDDFVIITAGEEDIIIGNNVHIAAFCGLFGSQGITLEDFSGLSSRVSIYSVSDDYSGQFLTNPTIPSEFRKISKGRVTLKKHVIVGSNSVILPGVTIGVGTAVGALTLVRKNLDEWSIYSGFLCRKITSRRKGLIELENEYLEGLAKHS